MKHSEPIGLSLTCVAMMLAAGNDTMHISIGAVVIVIGTCALIAINKYYMDLLNKKDRSQ